MGVVWAVDDDLEFLGDVLRSQARVKVAFINAAIGAQNTIVQVERIWLLRLLTRFTAPLGTEKTASYALCTRLTFKSKVPKVIGISNYHYH